MITVSPGRKKTIVIFCIFSFLGFCLAAMAYPENTVSYLGFFWSYTFRFLIYIACVSALFLLLLRLFTRRLLFQKALKFVYGIIFLPLLLLPIFRCYFKVPYIFCSVCPAQCPWGISRLLVFNTAILFNLSGKFWCVNICPFGTFQECQTQISKRNLTLPFWANLSGYAILFLFIGMYYLALSGLHALVYFENERYTWMVTTASAALLILIAAFFIPRLFCRYVCPVGTIAKLSSSFLHFIQDKRKRIKIIK